MYSKGAGKGGKHNWVHKETNIVSLSNVLLLLWEQWQGREFRRIVKSTASHHAYRYAQVTSQRLLYVAQPNEKPELLTAERMRVGASLFGIWNMVAAELPQLTSAVAELLCRKRNVNEEGDD